MSALMVSGVDLSLTSTGVARVRHVRGQERPWIDLARVRTKGTADDTLLQRSRRLRTIVHRVTQAVSGSDLVLVEDRPMGGKKSPFSVDLDGAWWLLVARLTGAGIPVVAVNITTVKTYATGKGSGPDTGKDLVLAAVLTRYRGVAQVSGNDEADALVLAAIGCRHLGHPIEPGPMPATHLRALAKIAWPNDLPKENPHG